MKRTLGPIAVILGLLLLTGCTSGPTTSDSGTAGSLPAPQDIQGPQPQNPEGITGQDAPAKDGGLSEDRKVVTSGTVTLTVPNPIRSADTAIGIVTAAGGRVDNRTEQPATDTQRASATLTTRIPADRLDRTLDALKKLGTVNRIAMNATDVTTQVDDVDARITALQTSVDRLLDLMSKATSTTDLIAIESALSQRQAELDSLTAQQASLADQVEMSTVTLELRQTGAVASGVPDSFWGGLVAGWNSLSTAGAWFLVALGVFLPWLGVLAVLGGVAWLIVWRVRRS